MSEQKRRGPMGGHGPGMRPTEKAKAFRGSMGKLFSYRRILLGQKSAVESWSRKKKRR